jgi:hypothetical protein
MINRWRNSALNGIIAAAHAGPIGLELFMALSALRWAVYLVVPWHIIPNARTETMQAMASILPACIWALAFLLLAMAQCGAALGRRYRLRRWVALFGAFWWLLIVAFDFVGERGSSTINLATFALAQGMNFILLDIAYDGENRHEY